MSGRRLDEGPDGSDKIDADLVHLAGLFVANDPAKATPHVRGLARRYRAERPELAQALIAVLRDTPLRAAPANAVAAPIDADSKLPLVREEYPSLPNEPIFRPDIAKTLQQVAAEHSDPARLWEVGLAPTRTALFVGPPGVGKTLAARWLAREIDRPLIVLDLASVMSSFLGRTGGNVRRVLDYARERPCVLLLDELDAVAKRRDDATEIGELKRLVTVLLQEIDTWPEGNLLLGATNHAELLDPAVWRRFEAVIDFPLPDEEALRNAFHSYLEDGGITDAEIAALSSLYVGASFSGLESEVLRARRSAAVQGISISDALLSVAQSRFRGLASADRLRIANSLMSTGLLSQRRVSDLTGVSRDTLRRHAMTPGD